MEFRVDFIKLGQNFKIYCFPVERHSHFTREQVELWFLACKLQATALRAGRVIRTVIYNFEDKSLVKVVSRSCDSCDCRNVMLHNINRLCAPIDRQIQDNLLTLGEQ